MHSNNVVHSPLIRSAQEADAAKICEVLIRSVKEICAKDYNDDPAFIAQWCSNKTPDIVASWIRDPDNYFVLSEHRYYGVVGVAMYRRSEAYIYLCYVVPEGLNKGLGSKLLKALEAEAVRLGNKELSLDSTITARNFYKKHGYVEQDGPGPLDNEPFFPMKKSLPSASQDMP
jgi:GNAT superfamily N-acetyltransferase